MRPERSFQGLILALQRYWADHGCVILQPYDMEVGAGTFHPATTLRALGPKPLERGLCAAVAPAQGRPLRRESQPAAALLPVSGDPEAVAAGPAGALSEIARRDRHRLRAARYPLCRGRLGKPDARRLGIGLGVLVRRHGGVAVHLFPAGRGRRMRAGRRRAHLRAGTARLLSAGRRPHHGSQFQRPRRQRASELSRCLPAGRAGILATQFRTCRHRDAVRAVPDGRGSLPEISRCGVEGRPSARSI